MLDFKGDKNEPRFNFPLYLPIYSFARNRNKGDVIIRRHHFVILIVTNVRQSQVGSSDHDCDVNKKLVSCHCRRSCSEAMAFEIQSFKKVC